MLPAVDGCIAVLGCGSIGLRHLRNLQGLGARRLTAFDPAPAARARCASELDIPIAETLDEVWRQAPRIVVVATPPASHVELIAAALDHECDVFTEKPLSHRMDGVGALAERALRLGRITMVGCNMRFHPGPRTIKELIAAGAVGDVLSARLATGSFLPGWRAGSDYTAGYSGDPAQGGAVLDCIHEIDLALWLLGPARLSAAIGRSAASIGLAVNGLAELLLSHDGGAISSVHLNFVQRDYRRTCQVIGTEGTVYWDFSSPVVERRTGSCTERHELPADWSVNAMYVDEFVHFLEAVEHRTPSACPIAEGAAALAIAVSARAALSAAPVPR